jgi:hypothetical protein
VKELAVFVAAVGLIGWGLVRGESPATVGSHEKRAHRPTVEEAGDVQPLRPAATSSEDYRGQKTVGNQDREREGPIGRNQNRTRGPEPVEV